ncbi:hypothetical protein [Psychromonas sp. MME2]|uniref:hypothetical protein n=1 Tax=unclassified Psychromonas TaxID=2614957 RepID=UPI00339BE9D8
MLKKFFSKKSSSQISVYLGTNRVAICGMADGRVDLLAQARVATDQEWGEALSSLVQQHKLQHHQVRVVLSRDFYQTFDIEKPKVEDSELLASIPFAIKDLVSESIFDLVVDYYDIPLQQHKGEQITVVCTAMKLVIHIRDLLLKCEMELKEISTEELSLTALLNVENETNALLSEERNALVFTVVKNGQLYFSHRIRGFNDLLALPLGEQENVLIDGLSLELQRALDYINSQLRIASINHLYVALSCPDINALTSQLGANLARKVEPFGEAQQYDFSNIVAYGLLMDELGK